MWKKPEGATLVTSTNIAGQDEKREELKSKQEREAIKEAKERRKKILDNKDLKGAYYRDLKGPFN